MSSCHLDGKQSAWPLQSTDGKHLQVWASVCFSRSPSLLCTWISFGESQRFHVKIALTNRDSNPAGRQQNQHTGAHIQGQSNSAKQRSLWHPHGQNCLQMNTAQADGKHTDDGIMSRKSAKTPHVELARGFKPCSSFAPSLKKKMSVAQHLSIICSL